MLHPKKRRHGAIKMMTRDDKNGDTGPVGGNHAWPPSNQLLVCGHIHRKGIRQCAQQEGVCWFCSQHETGYGE